MTIPTADVKEGLHMLPWGYRAAPGATEKTRHQVPRNICIKHPLVTMPKAPESSPGNFCPACSHHLATFAMPAASAWQQVPGLQPSPGSIRLACSHHLATLAMPAAITWRLSPCLQPTPGNIGHACSHHLATIAWPATIACNPCCLARSHHLATVALPAAITTMQTRPHRQRSLPF